MPLYANKTRRNMNKICRTKYERNLHKYANEKNAIYVHVKPKFHNMHFICKYIRYMLEYVRINMPLYAN